MRALDWITERTLPTENVPAHQRTGRRGEEAAYFYLRRLGYVMVARNFRSARRRGEIDLIGWDKDVLCFIEVKTRTTHDVKPAEAFARALTRSGVPNTFVELPGPHDQRWLREYGTGRMLQWFDHLPRVSLAPGPAGP